MDRDNASMTATQANSGGNNIGRRAFMKGVGATVGTAATVHYAPEDMNPVGNADAIAPLVIYGAAAAAGVGAGWLVNNYDKLTANNPADGLSASALENEVYQTTKTRKSTNASTFVDNRNIIESGLPNTLYSEGKLAAIDALNNGKTQSEVEAAALGAKEAHAVTVEKNFLRSWNESANEANSLSTTLVDHPDVTASSVLRVQKHDVDTTSWTDSNHNHPVTVSQTTTLNDGTSFTYQRIEDPEFGIWTDPFGSGGYGTGADNIRVRADNTSGDRVGYLDHKDWLPVWNKMQTAFTNVNDGLITWVSNIYSQVQSGDIDTTDLLSSADLATMSADAAGYDQAIRDLMALGVSTNATSKVEVNISSIDATISGKLAVTGDTTVSTGTVDPTVTDAESYYFTYDLAEGTGNWTAYQTGVDGGTVTFTSEPHPKSAFMISTTASETAEVVASDFTEDTTNGVWTVDISGQVETAITNIESVEYYSTVKESQFETIQLTKPFEVISMTAKDGTDKSSTDYTSAQAHDDTNYITQAEWEDREQRYKDLIDQYEESTTTSGGGGGFLGDGLFSDTKTLGIVAGGAALAALLFGNN